jgi:hypothetical protein
LSDGPPAADAPAQPRLEPIVGAANVATLSVVPLLAILCWPLYGPVTPLLPSADAAVLRRLDVLEEDLRRDPGDVLAATEVGRLWQSLGQPPWSWTALHAAELHGATDAESRLELCAAYLDIGELVDARRTLAQAERACRPPDCAESLQIKISLFTRLTDTMVKEGIDPRRDLAFTERVLRRLLREMSGAPPAPPRPPRRR